MRQFDRRSEQLEINNKSEECYVTESYKFQLRPGEGAVGRAYQSKEPVFFSDVSKRSVDDYKRKDLEKHNKL